MTPQQLGLVLEGYLKRSKYTVLKVLAVEADKSIKLNFAAQGRPYKWLKKKRPDGRAILTGKTGRLLTTTSTVIDYTGNRIIMRNSLPYAKIHNEGGVIQRKAGTVKLRSVTKVSKGGKKYKAGDKYTVSRFASMKHKRGVKDVKHGAYRITIPKREFLLVPTEDYPRITKQIQNLFK